MEGLWEIGRYADNADINRITDSVGRKQPFDAGANESIYLALSEFSVTEPIRRIARICN